MPLLCNRENCLSDSQVHRLVTGRPEWLSLAAGVSPDGTGSRWLMIGGTPEGRAPTQTGSPERPHRCHPRPGGGQQNDMTDVGPIAAWTGALSPPGGFSVQVQCQPGDGAPSPSWPSFRLHALTVPSPWSAVLYSLACGQSVTFVRFRLRKNG